jgi:hypothetical protein
VRSQREIDDCMEPLIGTALFLMAYLHFGCFSCLQDWNLSRSIIRRWRRGHCSTGVFFATAPSTRPPSLFMSSAFGTVQNFWLFTRDEFSLSHCCPLFLFFTGAFQLGSGHQEQVW